VQQKHEEGKRSRLLKYSHLGPLTRLTFDNFRLEGKSQPLSSAYREAMSYAQEPQGWLVLIGPSGCGKTHLAAAIANYRLSLGQPALFIATSDFLDHLRATFSPTSEVSYDELFYEVRDAPLLILDNLGAHSATPWAKEKLLQIVDYRYSARLPTVFTSRYSLPEMDEPLHTRLSDPSISKVIMLTEERITGGGVIDLELLKHMTFKGWDKRINLSPEERQNLEKAYALALEFAQSPEGWLVFLGDTGCGKTHLAAAIANYRREQNQPPLFISIPDFLDYLRSLFSEGKEGAEHSYRFFEAVKRAPLLILDDLGEQSSTPWAWEKLYQILFYRHNTRLPTVITSRLSLEELEERKAPIMSRIADRSLSIVWNIIAPDYRIDHLKSRARFKRR